MADPRTSNPLPERDADIDRWLREEVVPVMQAALADPDSLIPFDDVFEDIEALHAKQAR